MFVAHTFYALHMDIGPLGEREVDWSDFGDLDPRQPNGLWDEAKQFAVRPG